MRLILGAVMLLFGATFIAIGVAVYVDVRDLNVLTSVAVPAGILLGFGGCCVFSDF